MIRKIAILAFAAMVVTGLSAQPQRRLQEQKAAANNSASNLSVRARTQFAVSTTPEEQVNWKRDIYRELDLKKEANAALYYPEEPLGDRVNFFTLIFRLILEGKINAYEYRMDGNELFTDDNKLDIGNMLDKFYVYYKKENDRYIVETTDIPSIEVLKYYVKESNFIDRRTSDYKTKVTAICPVLMRQDVGDAATPYPMFWLNYDEISPYLSQTPAMTSSFNNTTNMSLDDYFVMRCYNGEIYKTSNLRNQPLAEYCDNDSLLKKEQQHIEKQLVDLEAGLWASAEKLAAEEAAAQSSDSTAVASEGNDSRKSARRPAASKTKTATVQASKPAKEQKTSAARTQTPKAPKTPKTPKSSSSGGRVSVNRSR